MEGMFKYTRMINIRGGFHLLVMRRIMVLGVIILFLCVSLLPTIEGVVLDEFTKLVEVKVREYDVDGTYREVIKKIPMVIAEELKESKDFDRILLILKEYNLVSKDASIEKYKNEVQKLARRIGFERKEFSIDRFKNIKSYNASFILNILCKVDLWSLLVLPIGLSFITQFLNLYLIYISYMLGLPFPILLPSVDLAIIGFDSICETFGLLGHQLDMDVSLVFIFGFVGVSIYIMDLWSIHGFSPLVVGF